MRQRELEVHTKNNYPTAWLAVQGGGYASACSELTTADKALLFQYTDGGHETLNESLHHKPGTNESVLGRALVAALAKLPPYEGEVQAGVLLRPSELVFYRVCCQTGTPVHWPAFLSTSTKPGVAMMFLRQPNKNCLFIIQSKTGRLIEAVSRFGLHGQAPGQNEGEVLFAPNTAFDVLAVTDETDETDYTRIVLDEL